MTERGSGGTEKRQKYVWLYVSQSGTTLISMKRSSINQLPCFVNIITAFENLCFKINLAGM